MNFIEISYWLNRHSPETYNRLRLGSGNDRTLHCVVIMNLTSTGYQLNFIIEINNVASMSA